MLSNTGKPELCFRMGSSNDWSSSPGKEQLAKIKYKPVKEEKGKKKAPKAVFAFNLGTVLPVHLNAQRWVTRAPCPATVCHQLPSEGNDIVPAWHPQLTGRGLARASDTLSE